MDDNVFWLDCDFCHKWFHGACVGVLSEQVPDQWFCDNCLIRKKIFEKKADIQKSTSIDLSVDMPGKDAMEEDGEVNALKDGT